MNAQRQTAYLLSTTTYGATKREKITVLGASDLTGWLMIRFADGFKIAAPADRIAFPNGAK